MSVRLARKFVADFETTVYNNQDHTEVWAAALVEIGTEDVLIFNCLDDFWSYLRSLKYNLIVYFHNVKFDGRFLLDYFLIQLKYKQALIGEYPNQYFNKDKYMHHLEVKYLISNLGDWYYIKVKVGRHIIEFRDSLKLLPFSVAQIGQAFKTPHQKLEMEYDGIRAAGNEISEEEKEYIKNDVLVVKEALEIMFAQDHTDLTIGNCCLREYRRIIQNWSMDRLGWDLFYPNLYKQKVPDEIGRMTIDAYIRKSHAGGWCYLVPEKANKVLTNGVTLDNNSIYSWVMHSKSDNIYPTGIPKFWIGNHIPDEALAPNRFYFVRFSCTFNLKKGKLPFIHIKGNPLYPANENLTTSDYWDYKTKKYYKSGKIGNELKPAIVTLTLTMMDFELFFEHYEVKNFKILDGCYFLASTGLFDEYIDKYMEQKQNSTGPLRTIAKLFLNNLPGKMASTTKSNFRVAHPEDNIVKFLTINENEKTPGYIPVGSAITSYARCLTIRAAQKNYHGPNKPGFIYSDTDALHCDCDLDKIKGVKIHPTQMGKWKIEGRWKEAIFVRPKTYIEVVEKEEDQDLDYIVKCAGMTDRCKQILISSMYKVTPFVKKQMDKNNITPQELKFIKNKCKLTDFKAGLKVPGRLKQKSIPGGVILVNDIYEM